MRLLGSALLADREEPNFFSFLKPTANCRDKFFEHVRVINLHKHFCISLDSPAVPKEVACELTALVEW